MHVNEPDIQQGRIKPYPQPHNGAGQEIEERRYYEPTHVFIHFTYLLGCLRIKLLIPLRKVSAFSLQDRPCCSFLP